MHTVPVCDGKYEEFGRRREVDVAALSDPTLINFQPPMRALRRFLVALMLICHSSLLFGQSTAFTYQGRLNDGSNPANGSYDLRFAVFDKSTNGNQQGLILTNGATSVSNGLFNVVLDFGNQFSGPDRWLEIAVRTNGNGNFITLSPRQPVTAIPYAITAANVLAGGIPSGIYTNAVVFSNPGNQFAGNGRELTNLNAANVFGTFTGNGSGLTGLNLAGNGITNLTAGQLATIGAAVTNGGVFNGFVKKPLNFAFFGKALGVHTWFQLNGGAWASQTGAGNLNQLTRTHRSNASGKTITDIQFLFQNPVYGYASSNVILVAALEYPTNVITQIQFNGTSYFNLGVLGSALSDPIGIAIPPTSNFWVRSFVTISPNAFFIQNGVNSVGNYGIGGGGYNNNTVTDITMGGTIADTFSFGYAPSLYLGRPMDGSGFKSICCLGDSWFSTVTAMYDTASPFDSTPQHSACYSNSTPLIPMYSIAIGGNTLVQELGTNWMGKNDGLYCSDIICEIGINDVRGAEASETTSAQIETNYVSLWTYYAARGIRIWQLTVGPNSTSTDSFATTNNQTGVNTTIHQQVNDWIRTKPYPLSGYFDAAVVFETATNSNIWIPGMTTDGLHIKSSSDFAQTNYISILRTAIAIIKNTQ